MLYYEKRLLGLPLLLRGVGSVLPRAVFPALVAAGLSLVFELTVPHEVLAELFVHPYPFQVFAYIVAFALVFRTNVGYNRYWEGRTQAAQMASKWGDAAAGALSYDMHARDDNGTVSQSRIAGISMVALGLWAIDYSCVLLWKTHRLDQIEFTLLPSGGALIECRLSLRGS